MVCTIAGEIEKSGLKVRWIIPDFFLFSWSVKNGDGYSSPHFQCMGSACYFLLYPNGCGTSNYGWVSLCLFEEDFKQPLNVTLNLGIENKDGKEYRSAEFKNYSKAKMALWFLKRWKLMVDRHDIAQDSTLTVFCTVSFDSTFPEAVQLTTNAASIVECTKNKIEATTENKYNSKVSCSNKKGAERSLRNFKALLISKGNSDVTLKVKNQEFQAHTVILGAQSSVFCSMFKSNFMKKRNGIVEITDCNPDAFQDFLLYLYSGEVEKMTTSNVVSLYTMADKYNVAELKVECMQFMIMEISVETFSDFVALALQYNESMLLDAGMQFFARNTAKVIVTVQWQSFMKENPVAANELHIKACNLK